MIIFISSSQSPLTTVVVSFETSRYLTHFSSRNLQCLLCVLVTLFLRSFTSPPRRTSSFLHCSDSIGRADNRWDNRCDKQKEPLLSTLKGNVWTGTKDFTERVWMETGLSQQTLRVISLLFGEPYTSGDACRADSGFRATFFCRAASGFRVGFCGVSTALYCVYVRLKNGMVSCSSSRSLWTVGSGNSRRRWPTYS